jgi:hypothetical protein
MSSANATDVGAGLAGRWNEAPPADVAVQLTNLLQAYALLTDLGRTDELAELFTPDAVWDGSEIGFGASTGPSDIAQRVTAHFRDDAPMMHLPGQPLLVAAGDDEVHGVGWSMATRWDAGRLMPTLHFYYEDVFRRSDDGRWRFARRVLRMRLPLAAP